MCVRWVWSRGVGPAHSVGAWSCDVCSLSLCGPTRDGGRTWHMESYHSFPTADSTGVILPTSLSSHCIPLARLGSFKQSDRLAYNRAISLKSGLNIIIPAMALRGRGRPEWSRERISRPLSAAVAADSLAGALGSVAGSNGLECSHC